MDDLKITEDFLHHVWKFRLFKQPVRDLDEEIVEIIDPGLHNHDAGPDFFNARIRTRGLVWAGNVEIHMKASHWYQHGHHRDPAYDNVILHVVLEADCIVCNSRMESIPTLCLEFHPGMYRKYSGLIKHHSSLPCPEEVQRIPAADISAWLEGMLAERLEERIHMVMRSLQEVNGDWEEVLYRFLARAFGQHVNAIPFEMLSRAVPLKTFLRVQKKPTRVEPILFGQAGLLPATPQDVYSWRLKRCYRRARPGINLRPMEGHLWKFLRLRPMNFPGVRIAQFAWLLYTYPDMFRELLDEREPDQTFMDLEIRTSKYWENHYIFGRKSRPAVKRPGTSFFQRLLINAVLPVRFARMRYSGRGNELSAWMNILRSMPPEDNRCTRMWSILGIPARDAFSSQALLQITKKEDFRIS